MNRWPQLRRALDAHERHRVARYSFLLGYVLGYQKMQGDKNERPSPDYRIEDLASQAYRQYLGSPQYKQHIVRET